MSAASLDDLDLAVYDFEVFCADWLVVFGMPDGSKRWFWNEERDALMDWLAERPGTLFCSFNGSHYDRWIMTAIAAGCSPEEVKEINDAIIGAGPDSEPIWEHPYLKGVAFRFNDVDLMKDTQAGTSLKSIEGHLGMSVEESEVDFSIGRPLTGEERDETLAYCVHDVDATARLLEERRGYLETKLALGERAGIEPARALAMTNAKLTAAVLGAVPCERDDEREYSYPPNLRMELIPARAVEFFDRVSERESAGRYVVPDDELWGSKLSLDVGGCPTTLGFGGIHGALTRYREEADGKRAIVNADVSSYYPSLMVKNGYTSRNIPHPDVFRAIYEERLEAKRNGDKETANALKLVVNTTYGATLNRYNDLYDPLMARSVCISGQLYLLELARALAEVPSLRIVQLNTDGIMVSLDRDRLGAFREICAEWQGRTGFELEEDEIAVVAQKDVNNYAMRTADGREKVKGGWLVRGISRAGAFSANNDATVVADALRAWLLDGTPPRETVMACRDPAAFQLIAKAGSKFSEVWQDWGGERRPMQRCSRVFACRDPDAGTLYKRKRDGGLVSRMAGLPERCLVSNGGMPPLEEIDREWYAALAERRAAEFDMGGDGGMAQTKAANARQRLAQARRMFYERAGAKSGVNLDQGWSYVELTDIAPLQTEIFAEVGLVEEFTYCEGASRLAAVEITPDGSRHEEYAPGEAYAESAVRNVDDPDDAIVFRLPWRDIEPIVSGKTGKAVDNALQREGKEQTFLRRYVKMQILDVALPDEIDRGGSGKPAGAAESAPAPRSRPATTEERAAVAEKLTGAQSAATALQLRQLRKAVKTLKEAHPDSPEAAALIAEISVSTSELTDVSKARAEEIIRSLGEMKERLDAGGDAK